MPNTAPDAFSRWSDSEAAFEAEISAIPDEAATAWEVANTTFKPLLRGEDEPNDMRFEARRELIAAIIDKVDDHLFDVAVDHGLTEVQIDYLDRQCLAIRAARALVRAA